MSAFEKLPREVRDMIYKYCLLYDGEIIPFPNIDEAKEIRNRGCKPAKPCVSRSGIEWNLKEDLRSCGDITYATDWPSVALLGVSKGIQEEAANVLFGMNVWRLSYVERWVMGEEKDLWYRYQHHFRHITIHMSMNDAGDMLQHIKMIRRYQRSHGWSDAEVKSSIHDDGLGKLIHIFPWLHRVLVRMCLLKSLVFNVENLLCPQGCCRKPVLHDLCRVMGQDGPCHRLKIDKKSPRSLHLTTVNVPKVDVKVIGLEDDSEKEIFVQRWGLEMDWGQGQ